MHSVVVKRSTERNLQLVYVIGPPRTDRLQEYDFGPEDFRSLSNSVDGYSLMTYDFSNPQNPGPNAPLVWIRSTMKLLLGTHAADSQNLTQKVFLGINFYGNDYALQGGTWQFFIISWFLSIKLILLDNIIKSLFVLYMQARVVGLSLEETIFLC